MKKIAQYGLLLTTTMLVVLTISTLDSFDSYSVNFLIFFSALAVIACIILIPKEDFNKLVFKDKWFNK